MLSLGKPERSLAVPNDAARVVAEVASLVEPACRHARVIFQHDAQEGLFVTADLEALRSAVLNLTLNAIEAAGPGGRVRLGMGFQEGSVRFEIVDSGPGPPAALGDTIFDPFVTTKAEGVGLGLAVARQVAADLGGTLSWNREAMGTTFHLALPGGVTGEFPRTEKPPTLLRFAEQTAHCETPTRGSE
jgi:signal transduction histidine kinase